MNTLVELTEAELRDEALRISNIEAFYNIAISDMYVDDLSLADLIGLSQFIKNVENYTVAQIKYVLDTAVTMVTE